MDYKRGQKVTVDFGEGLPFQAKVVGFTKRGEIIVKGAAFNIVVEPRYLSLVGA